MIVGMRIFLVITRKILVGTRNFLVRTRIFLVVTRIISYKGEIVSYKRENFSFLFHTNEHFSRRNEKIFYREGILMNPSNPRKAGAGIRYGLII